MGGCSRSPLRPRSTTDWPCIWRRWNIWREGWSGTRDYFSAISISDLSRTRGVREDAACGSSARLSPVIPGSAASKALRVENIAAVRARRRGGYAQSGQGVTGKRAFVADGLNYESVQQKTARDVSLYSRYHLQEPSPGRATRTGGRLCLRSFPKLWKPAQTMARPG